MFDHEAYESLRKRHDATRSEVATRLAKITLPSQQAEGIKKAALGHNLESPFGELAAKLSAMETELHEEKQARKQAEEALAQANTRFHAFVETIPQQVWTAHPDGTIDFVNERTLKYFNRSPEEMVGRNWQAVLHPEDLPRCMEAWTKALESGEPYEMEFRLRRGSDEAYLWHLGRALPLRDQTGRIMKWLGTNTDISEWKSVEEALRKSNARYGSLTESARDAIIVANAQGIIESWNAGAHVMFGYHEQDILGKSLTCLMPERYRQAHQEGMSRLQESRNHSPKIKLVELCGLRKDGSEFPIELSLGSWWEGDVRDFCGIIRDVTERKDAEVALNHVLEELETRVSQRTRELHKKNRDLQAEIIERHLLETRLVNSEARNKAIVSALPDDMILFGATGIITEVVNQPGTTTVGITSQCVNKRIDELFPPEFAAAIQFYIERAQKTNEVQFFEYQTTSNGTTDFFDVRFVSVGVGHVLSIVRNVSHQRQMEQQIRRHAKSLEGLVEERTHQIQILERQQMQSEKLAALGQLAAGVAHEINNPLAIVSNGFELIKRSVPTDHSNYSYVKTVDEGITRMIDIVRQMYKLYGGGKMERMPVEMGVVLRDALITVEDRLRQKLIKVNTRISHDCPRVVFPQSEVVQVLSNLIQNAVDASPDGADIFLSVEREENWCRISVTDSGSGISPEMRSKVFDPFFTTKCGHQKANMGLGLSISNSLVAAMGGRLELETQLGKGTTFTIVLPMEEHTSAHLTHQQGINDHG